MDILDNRPEGRPNIVRLEKQMPELFAEMRTDITNNPLMREFILKPKNAIYNGSPDRPVLVYHFEEHDNLRGMMQVLENHGLIRDITFNDVKRYVMEERLVSYLTQ